MKHTNIARSFGFFLRSHRFGYYYIKEVGMYAQMTSPDEDTYTFTLINRVVLSHKLYPKSGKCPKNEYTLQLDDNLVGLIIREIKKAQVWVDTNERDEVTYTIRVGLDGETEIST